MSGARNAVVANVSPDIEANQYGKDKENDYIKAVEVGSQFHEICSQDST